MRGINSEAIQKAVEYWCSGVDDDEIRELLKTILSKVAREILVSDKLEKVFRLIEQGKWDRVFPPLYNLGYPKESESSIENREKIIRMIRREYRERTRGLSIVLLAYY